MNEKFKGNVPAENKEKPEKVATSRRDFFKIAGAVSVGAVAGTILPKVALEIGKEKKDLKKQIESGGGDSGGGAQEPTLADIRNDLVLESLKMGNESTLRRLTQYIIRRTDEAHLLVLERSTLQQELLQSNLSEGVRAVVKIDLVEVESRLQDAYGHIEFYRKMVQNMANATPKTNDGIQRKKSEQLVREENPDALPTHKF